MTRSLRPARPRSRNDDERILPLINVVFLLLIFFMVAGRLAASDAFSIKPPRSATEASPTGDLLILIGTEGRLALGGERIEREALASTVSDRLADAAAVRVKADGRVEATRVVAIMEDLRSAGVERLELLTVPEAP